MLPLRPLVAALRIAHPEIVGLDDVTAADVGALTASARRALEARYLTIPGTLVTFAVAAERLGLTRAAVHFAERQAFQALGLSGLASGARGRRGVPRPAQSVGADEKGLAPVPTPPRERTARAPKPTGPATPRAKITHRSIAGEEEAALILAYQQGDHGAGAKLIEAHAPVIRFHAMKHRNRGLDDEDLLQEGRMGFLRAVAKFDPTMGASLATYSVMWIRAASQRAVADTGKTIRVPVGICNNLVTGYLRGIETPAGLAQAGFMTEDRAVGALAAALRPVSLDEPLFDDGMHSLVDTIASDDLGPDAAYEEAEDQEHTRESVAGLLTVLDERERYIVEKRIAVQDGDQMGLQEIGDHFGVCRERIRQLEAQALAKLRRAAVERGIMAPPVTRLERIDRALLVAHEAAADLDDTDADAEPEEPWLPTRQPRVVRAEPVGTASPMSSAGTRIDAFAY